MPLDFLTPPVRHLAANGEISLVHEGGVLGRLRPCVLLIARDLCTFSRFDTSNLPPNRRRQAAKLYARTASPYVVSVANLVKDNAGFGVWWWDAERLAPLLAGLPRGMTTALRPETLAQPIGADWRIVKLLDGYEAQLWSGKGLRASVWRRDRFDKASWSAFTRLQRDAPPAPDAPPPAQALPIATDSEAFSFSRTEISREQAAGLAAGGFATVMAATMVFMLGQGLAASGETTKVLEQTEQIRATTPRTAAGQSGEIDRQRLAAFGKIEERTNPLTATGAAIGIVAIHDLTPKALDATEDSISLTLPYSSIDLAPALIDEFEQSGYFYDVQPRTDSANQSIIFEMKVRQAASPLSVTG